MPSRVETLDRPAGAGRVPFLAILAVLGVVVASLLVGLTGSGWFLAFLVPIVAYTLFVMVSVLRTMARDARSAQSGPGPKRGEEEE